MVTDQLQALEAKMRADGLPELALEAFRRKYRRLAAGESVFLPEAELSPVESLPDAEELGEEYERVGLEAVVRTVLVKLNGGLGTSMGLDRAKSLLPVKDGLTFLDVIALQALDADVPLLLLNSFATRTDSLAALRVYPELDGRGLGIDLVQHRYPKLDRAMLGPVSWPAAPALEWAPPGHGDLYTSLVTSGVLTRLRGRGYRYAFVSNADNLGAALDPRLLGYLVREALPFVMEAAERAEADRKGGHLALRQGQLVLRELAQCPPGDLDAFQDVTRHRYFNTNSVWFDLDALAELLEEHDWLLELPLIRNEKTVDPRDPDSPPVYQLETAMGAAIGAFPGAAAIRVPRRRFAPVKTTNDLLAVRSDAFELTADHRIVPSPAGPGQGPLVDLDPDHYRTVDGLDAGFPAGPPSLVGCSSLTVTGQVVFGRGVVARGDVELVNGTGRPAVVPDGALLEGTREW